VAHATLTLDLDDTRLHEPAPTQDKLQPARKKRLPIIFDHSGHDFGSTGSDPAHVDADWTGSDKSELLCAVGESGKLRAANQGFGRDAGNVDARTADHALLDDGDTLAFLRPIHCQRFTSLAAAEWRSRRRPTQEISTGTARVQT
jgi:hypothetical protein